VGLGKGPIPVDEDDVAAGLLGGELDLQVDLFDHAVHDHPAVERQVLAVGGGHARPHAPRHVVAAGGAAEELRVARVVDATEAVGPQLGRQRGQQRVHAVAQFLVDQPLRVEKRLLAPRRAAVPELEDARVQHVAERHVVAARGHYYDILVVFEVWHLLCEDLG